MDAPFRETSHYTWVSAQGIWNYFLTLTSILVIIAVVIAAVVVICTSTPVMSTSAALRPVRLASASASKLTGVAPPFSLTRPLILIIVIIIVVIVIVATIIIVVIITIVVIVVVVVIIIVIIIVVVAVIIVADSRLVKQPNFAIYARRKTFCRSNRYSDAGYWPPEGEGAKKRKHGNNNNGSLHVNIEICFAELVEGNWFLQVG